jgi:hypothetical protein
MAKIHDEERESRITDQVIVDCYSESEEMMGWYYYVDDGLAFPLKGLANIPTTSGKTVQKKVKIVKIDPDSGKGKPLRIGVVENGGRVISFISPEYLIRIEESPESTDIINDWLYWHNFELL